MSKVVFYKFADKQLDYIFDYGYDNFGFERACLYLHGLKEALEEAARTRKYKNRPWREVAKEQISDLTNEPVYFICYERHVAFFRDLGSRIGVIAVLGDRQNLPSRIREAISGA